MDDCIFCKIVAGEIEADVVKETKDLLILMSLENHPIIITKEHIQDIYSVDNKMAGQIMIEAVKMAKAVKKIFKCEGMNLLQNNGIAAGQGVFHFHLHIIPRFADDGLKLSIEGKPVSKEIRQRTAKTIQSLLSEL